MIRYFKGFTIGHYDPVLAQLAYFQWYRYHLLKLFKNNYKTVPKNAVSFSFIQSDQSFNKKVAA